MSERFVMTPQEQVEHALTRSSADGCVVIVADQPNERLAGALRGMTAVCAGMIGAAGLRLAGALKKNTMPLSWCAGICAAGFVLVALLKYPLVWVLFGLGGLGCILTWRRLKT